MALLFSKTFGISVGLVIAFPALMVGHTDEETTGGIDLVVQQREATLVGYTAMEEYTVKTRHFDSAAKVIVAVQFTAETGTMFKVLSRTGPSLLRNRVVDRILQEQVLMSRPMERSQTVVNSSNYEMNLAGQQQINGIVCDVLEITPKRKSPHLLKGTLWVNALSKRTVRIEGRPVVTSSFFAGRPSMTLDYEDIQGFSMLRHSRAVTSSLLWGSTEVLVDLIDYQITAKSR